MIRSFYKYARNQYLGDSLNNFVCTESIWIIFIYALIPIKTKYYSLLKNTKEWEGWTPIPIFSIDSYKYFTLLYLISCKFIIQTTFHQTFTNYLIFSEYYTWEFNYSLWVQYPSLETNYYLWYGTLAVK